MRNLDVTTLRSFVAVSDHGGVTRAAGALNLTQSAVSMQLKRLEEVLGITLLDRSNRKIGLTGPGEQLLGYARRMLELNDEIVSRLTDQIWEGEVILGVPHDIVYPVIPKVLKQFNTAYPRVKVRLISSHTLGLIEAFGRGEIDLILTTESKLGPGGETLMNVPLRWFGAPGGTAWKQRPLPIGFCRRCLFRPSVIKKLDQEGLDWDLVVDAESDRTIEATVSADLALTAILEGHAPPFMEMIPRGAGLPDLGSQKINIYGGCIPKNELVSKLAEMVHQGFCVASPMVVNQS